MYMYVLILHSHHLKKIFAFFTPGYHGQNFSPANFVPLSFANNYIYSACGDQYHMDKNLLCKYYFLQHKG